MPPDPAELAAMMLHHENASIDTTEKHSSDQKNNRSELLVKDDNEDEDQIEDNALSLETDSRQNIPSNEFLLATAFVTFTAFALTQFSFAIVAKSEAMMGDSAAMMVDSLTYLFNYLAEVQKKELHQISLASFHQHDQARASYLRLRYIRKRTLRIEIIPPTLSVATLIVVTAFVLHKAVHVLMLDRYRPRSEQSNPNLGIMLIFSVINLLLDIINVACFAKAQHLFGFPTSESGKYYSPIQADDYVGQDDSTIEMQSFSVNLPHKHLPPPTRSSTTISEQHERANLNMCSAYTHIFADTLRSLAVIISTITADVFNQFTPEEADATAAVIVSVLIIITLIPLAQGLKDTVLELQAIKNEENSELQGELIRQGLSPGDDTYSVV